MNRQKFSMALVKIVGMITVALVAALIAAPDALAGQYHYKILYKFTGGADGGQPNYVLILDAAGNLYGTTTAGGKSGQGTVFKLTRNADGSWTESVLYSLAGGGDGAAPSAAVTFNATGKLYGTTMSGGAFSAGTVFELAPNTDGSWTESVLYSFTGGSDGANPQGVIVDAAGNLYGATSGGGINGQGIVYRLVPNPNGSWAYTLLHSFEAGKDGSYPLQGKLTFDKAGNLFGATGDNVDAWGDCPFGSDCGSLFEMTANLDGSWSEKVIFRFHNSTPSSGRKPAGPVIFDSAGILYGATQGGGGWYGNVFKLTLGADGKWTERVLHTFKGDQDGAYLGGSVVFDKDGNLYGTTALGEDADGACCYGQVFTLLPRPTGWAKYAMHRFTGPPADGSNSGAGIVIDAAGNLYGTTGNGGPHDSGVVFEISQ